MQNQSGNRNVGYNILAISSISVHFDSSQVLRELIFCEIIFASELPRELTSQLRPGFYVLEILRNFQNWLGSEPSPQYPSEMNFWQLRSKIAKKQILKFPNTVQFCMAFHFWSYIL